MRLASRPWAGFVALACFACTAPEAADVSLDTEEQKTVYAMGLAVSRGVVTFDMSDEEKSLFVAGVQDGLPGGDPKVDIDAYQPKVRAFLQEGLKRSAEAERMASADFVAQAASQPGATQLPSGLVYSEIEPGEGATAASTDTVKVHYHGTLRDGSVFDSSIERGEPAVFPLNRVIPCWTEALQRMRAGGKAWIVCPSDIAYGERGAPPHIKPGAALSFEVELLEIMEPQAEPGSEPGS